MATRLIVLGLFLTLVFAGCSGGSDSNNADGDGNVADDDTVIDDDASDDDSATTDDDSDDDASDDDTWPPLPDDDSDDDTVDDDTLDDDTEPVECEAIITRQPYMQWVTKTSARVFWRTNVPGYSLLDWGTDESLGQQILSNDLVRWHDVEITGLESGHTYYYRAESCGVQSEIKPFHTAPEPAEPFKFMVWGDTQEFAAVHAQVAARAELWEPDLALHVGDLVDAGWTYGEYDEQFFGPAVDLLDSVPVFPAIGNHDGQSVFYYSSFYFPKDGGSYSFTYGNVFFIALNTCWLYIPGSWQYRWFVEQLASDAAADADWVVVYHHQPPYSEGWVGYDGEPMVREFLVPLYEDYGVDLVFNGHTHDYERGTLNGVTYVITGGGGGALDTWARDWPHIEVWSGVHHFTGVSVNGTTIDIEAIDVDGNTIDTYQLAK